MFSKTGLIALCAAVAVKGVAAGHAHERLHADKRNVVYAATETVYLTDVVTVTVTEGQKPTDVAIAPSIKAHTHHHTTVPHVVAEPSPVVHTTLVTSKKPSSTKSVPKPQATAADAGIKRGLAYNDISLVQTYSTLGGIAGWSYNWDSSAWGDLPQGISFAPMLWSPAPEHSNQWNDNANNAIASGNTDCLLSFNEPDIASQAAMSPVDAANAHKQWMNPFAGQARIGSPAVSSSENPNQGADWLKQFFAACNGECQVDFCVAHWYGPGGDTGADLFLQHLKDIYDVCAKPVWVTEFAALDGDKDQFMRRIVSAIETDSQYNFVERYSYFYAAVGELFDSPTELSSFGKIYAGLSS